MDSVGSRFSAYMHDVGEKIVKRYEDAKNATDKGIGPLAGLTRITKDIRVIGATAKKVDTFVNFLLKKSFEESAKVSDKGSSLPSQGTLKDRILPGSKNEEKNGKQKAQIKKVTSSGNSRLGTGVHKAQSSSSQNQTTASKEEEKATSAPMERPVLTNETKKVIKNIGDILEGDKTASNESEKGEGDDLGLARLFKEDPSNSDVSNLSHQNVTTATSEKISPFKVDSPAQSKEKFKKLENDLHTLVKELLTDDSVQFRGIDEVDTGFVQSGMMRIGIAERTMREQMENCTKAKGDSKTALDTVESLQIPDSINPFFEQQLQPFFKKDSLNQLDLKNPDIKKEFFDMGKNLDKMITIHKARNDSATTINVNAIGLRKENPLVRDGNLTLEEAEKLSEVLKSFGTSNENVSEEKKQHLNQLKSLTEDFEKHIIEIMTHGREAADLLVTIHTGILANGLVKNDEDKNKIQEKTNDMYRLITEQGKGGWADYKILNGGNRKDDLLEKFSDIKDLIKKIKKSTKNDHENKQLDKLLKKINDMYISASGILDMKVHI